LAQTGRRFSGEPSGEPWVMEAPWEGAKYAWLSWNMLNPWEQSCNYVWDAFLWFACCVVVVFLVVAIVKAATNLWLNMLASPTFAHPPFKDAIAQAWIRRTLLRV
jgi:hypothetical protein